MKEAHRYGANNEYLDSQGSDFSPNSLDSRLDADVDPDAPICIGMGYNANINWIL